MISSQTLAGTYDVWSDGTYKFSWVIDPVGKTITCTLDAATTGWVAVGFSPDGTMINSDIILGYVDSAGAAQVTDRYATARAAPAVDTSQAGQNSITTSSGVVAAGRTKIIFTRLLNTGDSKDIQINDGATVNVIFAIRTSGNPSTENGVLNKHTRTGSAGLLLYKSSVTIPTVTVPNSAKGIKGFLFTILFSALLFLF
jgi:hypothetical protein